MITVGFRNVSKVLSKTKGQKANKKRMATVATVFTRAPWVRTPPQVIDSFPTSRPCAGWGASAPTTSGEQARMGEFAQGKDRRYRGGGCRDGPPRSLAISDAPGLD